MDALKQTVLLKEQLEAAQETAAAIRDELQNVEHMDLTYIGLALETVGLRINYLENQAKLGAKTKKEKAD